MASQTVGTPAVSVTRSRTIRSRTLAPSRYGPGNTCPAPNMVAGERQAPRVHVKHRHDWQDDVALADRQRVDKPL